MATGYYRFGHFALDPAERKLSVNAEPVELNARYFDALLLLLREPGVLVTKDCFLQEVWNGVPVTDDALTQCIKTLRRQLGDNASSPSYIETVPKHGYRFIAPVEWLTSDISGDEAPRTQAEREREAEKPISSWSWQQFLHLGAAGTTGGGIAGLVGGLLFGFIGAAQSQQSGIGSLSVLLVLVSITILIAIVGAAGVSFGIAAAGFTRLQPALRLPLGGAIGGFLTGGFIKLLGIDAFQLLFGQSPGDITGAKEGIMLGAAIGIGLWLAQPRSDKEKLFGRSVTYAIITGSIFGALIPLTGGRLMGGSLALLSDSFPDSRLRFDPLVGLFGGGDSGILSQVLTAGMEGALFSACIIGAIELSRRTYSKPVRGHQ